MSTETAPESCPFCGAALGCVANGKPAIGEDRDWARFECGTYWYREYENQREDQTPICITAERERLTRERDEARKQQRLGWERAAENFRAYEKAQDDANNLLARVKRLEEAGDEVVEENDIYDRRRIWRKATAEEAKEAKP